MDFRNNILNEIRYYLSEESPNSHMTVLGLRLLEVSERVFVLVAMFTTY